MQTHDSSPTLDHQYARFPMEFYWKLIIDSQFWALNDPLVFDKDQSKGYLDNAVLALFLMLYTMSTPVDVDYIVGLHDCAFHDKDKNLGFRTIGTSGIGIGCLSKQGLIELHAKLVAKDSPFTLLYLVKEDDPHATAPPVPLEDLSADDWAEMVLNKLRNYEWSSVGLRRKSSLMQVRQDVNQMLKDYHRDLQQCSADDKLKKIATFIRDIHQYHPFKDGNGRTFIFLLLNKLLVMNNLSPSIIGIPGKFSGYGIDELVQEIKNGQLLFSSLLDDGKPPLTLKGLQDLLKIDNDDLLQKMAAMHVKSLYARKSVGEVSGFIRNNLQNIFEYCLPNVFEPATIDQVVGYKLPPSLVQPMINCIFSYNFYALSTLGKFATRKELEEFISTKNLEAITMRASSDEIKLIIKNLSIHPKKIFDLLISKQSTSNTDIPVLWNLIVSKKFDAFFELINNLTTDFEKFMQTIVNGIKIIDYLRGNMHDAELLKLNQIISANSKQAKSSSNLPLFPSASNKKKADPSMVVRRSGNKM